MARVYTCPENHADRRVTVSTVARRLDPPVLGDPMLPYAARRGRIQYLQSEFDSICRQRSFLPETRTCPYQPPPDVHPQPGGAARLLPVLLVKPDGTGDEPFDGLLSNRSPGRAEMIAEEIEASLGPANEGLVRVVNFRLWLQADIQPPEIEVCSSPNSGHSRGRH